MAENRRGGTIFFKIDSVQRDAKGNFTYNAGGPKREAMIGADLVVQGYKEMGQITLHRGRDYRSGRPVPDRIHQS